MPVPKRTERLWAAVEHLADLLDQVGVLFDLLQDVLHVPRVNEALVDVVAELFVLLLAELQRLQQLLLGGRERHAGL